MKISKTRIAGALMELIIFIIIVGIPVAMVIHFYTGHP